MTWRKYLILMLGRAEAEAQNEPEQELNPIEQEAVRLNAMDILTQGPVRPE